MSVRRTAWYLLPAYVRRLPADLAALFCLTLLVNVTVFAPIVRDTPLRIGLGLVFVLFVPGYAFIAALFPEAGGSPIDDVSTGGATSTGEETPSRESTTRTETTATPDRDSSTDRREDRAIDSDRSHPERDSTDRFIGSSRSGIDGIERVALSFGLSIALVPLIGLILNFTPWGIRLTPIMVALSTFTVVATAIAAIRRRQLPVEERFQVPYRNWLETGRGELFEPETRTDGLLNVLLVLSILLAVGAISFAVVVPPQGEQFSAIYLLTEDDDGDLVADGYPTEFIQGDSADVIVGVDNHEHERTSYTIIALEQEVVVDGNESRVTDQRELDRFEIDLDHNESAHTTYDLEPTLVGEDIRIVWLLFVDESDIPDDPSMDDTEYSVHLWVNVSESDT